MQSWWLCDLLRVATKESDLSNERRPVLRPPGLEERHEPDEALERSLEVLRRSGLCTAVLEGGVVCGHTALWVEKGEPRCREYRYESKDLAG